MESQTSKEVKESKRSHGTGISGVGCGYFVCQRCHARLEIEKQDDSATTLKQKVVQDSTSVPGPNESKNKAQAVYGDARNTSAEESFILLSSSQHQRPEQSLSDFKHMNLYGQRGQQSFEGSRLHQNPSSPRTVEDSFVDVTGSTASGDSNHAPGKRMPDISNEKAETLASIFEIASERTKIDQPLCSECSTLLLHEMEQQIEEAESDCLAYEQALQRLAKEQDVLPMPEEEFQKEIQSAMEEERKEMDKMRKLEEQLQLCQEEQKELENSARELDSLETRYWKDFNNYKLQLNAYMDEKDALINKIESACAQLELLKRTNIYNDAFHIWHDGPFGTINSFRLGRTSDTHIEWDEINAAWGQAVLLLHTMARSCDFEFSKFKLLPMGSYPRISDSRNTYELYGPVTQFLRANYDKAMVCFLTCVQEFAIYAQNYDIEKNTKPAFELPYKIEGDKICGHTVRLRFNGLDKWTKALKYMLANLKVTLVWLTSSGPLAKKKVDSG